jgi:hypothetical protein
LSFIYPIYSHNCRNISTIYIYKTRLASKEIFSPTNKIHREVGGAKDLSAPRYNSEGIDRQSAGLNCFEYSPVKCTSSCGA